jgi:hypothetical protein
VRGNITSNVYWNDEKEFVGPAIAAFVPFLVAAGVEAQMFTPTFTSPRLLNEMGVYVNDGPGDISVEGIWRGGPLGLRVGFVDWQGGLLSLGAEYRMPMPHCRRANGPGLRRQCAGPDRR